MTLVEPHLSMAKIYILIVLFLFAEHCGIRSGIGFEIIDFIGNFYFQPSPSINAYQSAFYRCSSDNNDVGIVWRINGSSQSNNTDIVMNGVGTPSSSLTIRGLPQYNNTVVECRAIGHDSDGNFYYKSRNSTLKIQGVYNNKS